MKEKLFNLIGDRGVTITEVDNSLIVKDNENFFGRGVIIDCLWFADEHKLGIWFTYDSDTRPIIRFDL